MNEENTTPETIQPTPSGGNKTKIFIFIIPVIILLGLAGYFYYTNKQSSSAETAIEGTMDEEALETNEQQVVEESTPSGDAMNDEANVKTFTVTAGNYYFEPKSITVNRGDKVKIVLNNVEGTHDWNLDEFNAKSGLTQTGKTATVEFTADQSGQFEYYCSVANHRAMGMVGTLIVN